MADEIKGPELESRNFIHAFIEEDVAPGGQFEGMTVHTRFPPEPVCKPFSAISWRSLS